MSDSAPTKVRTANDDVHVDSELIPDLMSADGVATPAGKDSRDTMPPVAHHPRRGRMAPRPAAPRDLQPPGASELSCYRGKPRNDWEP
jgi:hypothetical protein